MASHNFPETDWQLVARGADAVQEIVQIYRPALHAHLSFSRHVRTDDIDDLVSGFVLSEIIQRDLIGRADQKRGRFRDLLRVALDRFVNGQYRYANAQRRKPRGPVFSLDDNNTPGKPKADMFDVEWAKLVLSRSLARMEADCVETGQLNVWTIFNRRLLTPLTDNTPCPSYRLLRAELNLRSPSQAANLLTTAKRMYKRHLHAIIAEYATSQGEIEEEILELLAIFSNLGA